MLFEEPETIGRALGNTTTAVVLPQIVEVGKAVGNIKELVRLQGERLLNTQAPDERGEATRALLTEALARLAFANGF